MPRTAVTRRDGIDDDVASQLSRHDLLSPFMTPSLLKWKCILIFRSRVNAERSTNLVVSFCAVVMKYSRPGHPVVSAFNCNL